jgi:hypothetical protein
VASPAYERRNERARAAGYRNYYDQRTKQAASRGLSRPQARGHARRDELPASVIRDVNRSTRPATLIPMKVDGKDALLITTYDSKDRPHTRIVTDVNLGLAADQLGGAGVNLLRYLPDKPPEDEDEEIEETEE